MKTTTVPGGRLGELIGYVLNADSNQVDRHELCEVLGVYPPNMPILVNYNLPFEEMIARGHYSFRDEDIKKVNLSVSKSGKCKLVTNLFHFGDHISISEIRSTLRKKGCWMTNVVELLAFRAQYPDFHRSRPIIAPMSVIKMDCASYVPALESEDVDGELHHNLSLSWSDVGFRDVYVLGIKVIA